MGNIKYEDKAIKKITVYYSIMIGFVILFFITFNCLFKNTTQIHIVAISDVSHYIPRLNDFRLDWISDIIWIVIQVFSCGIWFYFAKTIFCNFFNISAKNRYVPLGLGLVVVFVLNILQIPFNEYNMFLSKYFWWVTTILSQVPILLFICIKFGKRRKYYADAIKE